MTASSAAISTTMMTTLWTVASCINLDRRSFKLQHWVGNRRNRFGNRSCSNRDRDQLNLDCGRCALMADHRFTDSYWPTDQRWRRSNFLRQLCRGISFRYTSLKNRSRSLIVRYNHEGEYVCLSFF